MKKHKATIKKVVKKIVNSKLRIEIKNENLCDKNIQTELGASTHEFHMIIGMLEKYFNILFDDSELEHAYSVNSLTNIISGKYQPEVKTRMMEYN